MLVEERIAPAWEKCEMGVGQGTGAGRKRMEKEGRGMKEEEGEQKRGLTCFLYNKLQGCLRNLMVKGQSQRPCTQCN